MSEKVLKDIKFVDGSEQINLRFDEGVKSVDEFSQTASNLILSQGGGRYKLGDPTFSEFEQETWEGG